MAATLRILELSTFRSVQSSNKWLLLPLMWTPPDVATAALHHPNANNSSMIISFPAVMLRNEDFETRSFKF